jgi:hypothetical protein
MLGIRGAATETSQTDTQQQTIQKEIDRIYRSLYGRGVGSSSNSSAGLNLGGSFL